MGFDILRKPKAPKGEVPTPRGGKVEKPQMEGEIKKQAVKAVTATIHDLKNSSDMSAREIHQKTSLVRRVMDAHPEIFSEKREVLDRFLATKEREAAHKYYTELSSEVPDEAKEHLDALEKYSRELEGDENKVINSSKQLMVAVNRETLVSQMEAKAVPKENLNRSKKVLDYLILLHEMMGVSERQHIENFKNLLEKAEEYVKK